MRGSLPLPIGRPDRYPCKKVRVRLLNLESGLVRIEFCPQPGFDAVDFSFLNQEDLVLNKFSDLAEDIDKSYKKFEAERRKRWGTCKFTVGGVKATLEQASKHIQRAAKLPAPPLIIGFSSPEENAEFDKILKERGYEEVSPNHWERKNA